MDALACETVEIGRQGGDQRFAFARDHLGDVAAVQNYAAEDLHVEVPHVLGAAGGLAAGGERFGQQVLERSALGQAFAELRRQAFQLFVAQGAHSLFQAIDLFEMRSGNDPVRHLRVVGANVAELADVALVAGAEEAGQEPAGRFAERGETVAKLLPEAYVYGGIGSHETNASHAAPCDGCDSTTESTSMLV